MNYKEFNEFENPLEADYDISSSLKQESQSIITPENPYIEKLIDLIGFLEDVTNATNEELLSEYGISINEYYNPTAKTIEKVSDAISAKESFKYR